MHVRRLVTKNYIYFKFRLGNSNSSICLQERVIDSITLRRNLLHPIQTCIKRSLEIPYHGLVLEKTLDVTVLFAMFIKKEFNKLGLMAKSNVFYCVKKDNTLLFRG